MAVKPDRIAVLVDDPLRYLLVKEEDMAHIRNEVDQLHTELDLIRRLTSGYDPKYRVHQAHLNSAITQNNAAALMRMIGKLELGEIAISKRPAFGQA